MLSGSPSRAEDAIQRDIGDYLMKAIQMCWIMPADTKRIARVQMTLNKDGSLAGPPKIIDPVTPLPDKVAEAAVRAITRCAPFPGLASYATHYDLWRDVILTFNPGDAAIGHPKLDAKDIDKLFEKYGKKTK